MRVSYPPNPEIYPGIEIEMSISGIVGLLWFSGEREFLLLDERQVCGKSAASWWMGGSYIGVRSAMTGHCTSRQGDGGWLSKRAASSLSFFQLEPFPTVLKVLIDAIHIKLAHPTLIEADMVGDQVCTQRHSAAKDRPRAQNTVTRRRAHHWSSPPECSVILLTAVHMDYCVQCRIICAFWISQHLFLLRSVVWVKLYEHIALRCSTKLLYVPGFRIRPTTTTVCSSTPQQQQQCSAFSVNMIFILCVLCKSLFYL